MMRSLYSGVAGLKTHQTKMDVIGNNIANTNTVGFKSSSVNFTDTYYQMISSASGANADLGTAGTNAKQIGLGSMVAAIQTNITDQGGPSTTNRALDVAINGEAFLVVRSGSETCFTKSGALNIDEAGNLYCTTNGATVQGWLADEDGNIVKDTVQDLAVMSAKNQYYEPEATGAVTLSGNVDPNDADVAPTADGQIVTFGFFDNLGDSYMVKLSVKKSETQATGVVNYDISVVDVYNSDSKSIFVTQNDKGEYVASGASVTFGNITIKPADGDINKTTGELVMPENINTLTFDSSTGDFSSVTAQNAPTSPAPDWVGKALVFSVIGLDTVQTGDDSTFPQYDAGNGTGGVKVYFDSLTQYSQGGTSKLTYAKGDPDNRYTGNKAGHMTGVSIDQEGKIYGTYDNGMKKCLAQMAVATFSNPSGLESLGNSLFADSLNSGEFDGIGEEISLTGSFTVGALEMSNVDLANEFTQMIITQRGFQANSRIITTSDSMLEELVNLKR
ncbi:MAG: flagellar hook-basal body complex protein [Butyribacter sp.]|nr:flagellar hook-basal body complex protein [bacterium]MDY3855260.1 flagellar hook-basal body complex protein [Butyribacter sp.]